MTTLHSKQQQFSRTRQQHNNFANSKVQCLGKRDKSSAGRIDPKVVEICAVINDLPFYYTTSSCAGRCYLYRGPGIKSTNSFERFRVNHDKIHEPERYFDLTTLETDPTGGGDPVRSIGQYDYNDYNNGEDTFLKPEDTPAVDPVTTHATVEGNSLFLRFEPFILHVACRSLETAAALMNAARPSFKNVGLTTWKDSRYLVAIWGDEGLDMPVSLPQMNKHTDHDMVQPIFRDSAMLHWLAALINERHDRNWSKIDRFVQTVRETISSTILESFEDEVLDENCIDNCVDEERNLKGLVESPCEDGEFSLPRSYDVVGDVAIVHESFTTASMSKTRSIEEWEKVGELLMQKNKSIKVVALQNKNLQGTERAPSELVIVAGARRFPLITTHSEYGIKCVVDLNQTFFTPRMAKERLRICQQVARGEHVLVLFAGVAMEALQIAGRTEPASVTSVELNPVAVECAKRAHRMLERNKAVKCKGAADRLVILEGDVLQILPTLPKHHYDRILAPRPKEGSMDGDIGTGDGGLSFLVELLAVLKRDGGECHWYDFVADHEYPECERSKRLIEGASRAQGLDVNFLHVARVGSVAMRQFRVCIDFRIKNSTLQLWSASL
ncbi:hypothetical protein FisN_10Lh010 [Fistulifera solaris]|uniref:SAM-dependent methyltransferase TRM5/TYW2-type domain-containing protein n=1 Tax=Fistulifera solaris TaxID=1519565 RepID=A0A1Z5JT08_FISSO|nr:hypothetical protein FisN_10Lh010 [Fistulifera solaris]|eukprot:GAX17165.1 hypothetical protein FisN_10Lh010 [Fistulifera solaris]